jgi:hypothetical protein
LSFITAYRTDAGKAMLTKLIEFGNNYGLDKLRCAPPDLEQELELQMMNATINTRSGSRDTSSTSRTHDDIVKRNEEIRKRNEKREEDQFELFSFFAKLCLPCVGPKKMWEDKHRTKLLSSFITMTDEAFALIIFDNNIETFMALGLNKQKNVSAIRDYLDSNGITSKYTSAKGRDVGWSDEGMDRFEDSIKAVGEARSNVANPNYRDMDSRFLEECGNDTAEAMEIAVVGRTVPGRKCKARYIEL